MKTVLTALALAVIVSTPAAARCINYRGQVYCQQPQLTPLQRFGYALRGAGNALQRAGQPPVFAPQPSPFHTYQFGRHT
jgi:hypothetical protein